MINIDDMADALTIEETAQILGVNYRTVRRMLTDRQIEYLQFGSGKGRVVITRRALTEFLNRNKITIADDDKQKTVRLTQADLDDIQELRASAAQCRRLRELSGMDVNQATAQTAVLRALVQAGLHAARSVEVME